MEVYINGEWGTACDKSWDPLEGKVVCQQLGFKAVKHTYANTRWHNFSEGTGPSWLTDLHCNGSETNLLQCHSDHGIGRHSGCSHYFDVGITCTNASLSDEGE